MAAKRLNDRGRGVEGSRGRGVAVVCALVVLLGGMAGGGRGQNAESVPPGFEGAIVLDKPNAQVLLQLTFTDEQGNPVRLADYFKKDRPVILSMVYYNCPMLCNLTLNGIVTAVKPMPLQVGRDYQVLLVSFNPQEKSDLARAKKATYMKELARPANEPGWAFLTGTDANARALGDALGFGYKLDPKGEQYLHQAAIYLCTPDGHVARTIAGVTYDSDMLHDSLVAASAGKISSGLFGAALSCGLFHYDPATGKYTWAAVFIVRVTALLTILALGSLIVTLLYRDARKKKAAATHGSPPT